MGSYSHYLRCASTQSPSLWLIHSSVKYLLKNYYAVVTKQFKIPAFKEFILEWERGRQYTINITKK